jgi:nicotinic acid mononucleotide adenylyltransferase
MGSDLIPLYKEWEQGERLSEEVEFIIMSRSGYEYDVKDTPKNYRKLDTQVEGSSTKIRTRIQHQIEKHNKLNLGINGLTTTSVINYIRENHLYNKTEHHCKDGKAEHKK